MSDNTIPPLSAKEAKALDTAITAILERLALCKGASMTLNLHNYHGTPSHDLTFFSVGNEQHNGHSTRAFMGQPGSGKVNAAFVIQNAETDDQDELRARRVQRLRDELARLEAAESAAA